MRGTYVIGFCVFRGLVYAEELFPKEELSSQRRLVPEKVCVRQRPLAFLLGVRPTKSKDKDGSFLSSRLFNIIAVLAKFGRTGLHGSPSSAVTSDVAQCMKELDCTSCRSEGVVPSSLISSFLSLQNIDSFVVL